MQYYLLQNEESSEAAAPTSAIPPSVTQRERVATDEMRRLLLQRQRKQRCPPRPLPRDIQVRVLQNELSSLQRWKDFNLDEYRRAKKQRAIAYSAFHASIRHLSSTIRSVNMLQREIEGAEHALATLLAS
jgi:hypothetical protein